MSTFSIQKSRIAAFSDFTTSGDGAASQFSPLSYDNFSKLEPHDLRQRGITTIVVNNEHRKLVDVQTLTRCRLAGIRILNDVEFREKESRTVDVDRLEHDWLAYGNALGSSAPRRFLARAFDILLSLAILVITLPVLLLTALLIRLDSRGPVFYRQTRVGLLGNNFEIIKFRSMRVDAEVGGTPVWAAERDPRVTRVGRIIRMLRIDELPQLYNVLRGEMSVIGPRPERPQFVEKIAAQIPRFHDRSFVKPGITGWAQVCYPYGASIEDAKQKLAFDLYYIKYRSIFLDLKICFATLRVILFREGAR